MPFLKQRQFVETFMIIKDIYLIYFQNRRYKLVGSWLSLVAAKTLDFIMSSLERMWLIVEYLTPYMALMGHSGNSLDRGPNIGNLVFLNGPAYLPIYVYTTIFLLGKPFFGQNCYTNSREISTIFGKHVLSHFELFISNL